MLSRFQSIDPHMERIVDIGFSPPVNSQNLSLEDEKILYLNAQASNVLVHALRKCRYCCNIAFLERS
jgi:hypothetical protein